MSFCYNPVLSAGRDLDTLVAEGLMGWERWTCADYGFMQSSLFRPGSDVPAWQRCGRDIPLAEYGAAMVPRYSEDIALAWQVVETMIRHGARLGMTSGVDGYRVQFFDVRWRGASDDGSCDHPYSVGEAVAPTAALAICQAALRAVEMRE